MLDDQFTHALTQDGTNQDIRVKHDCLAIHAGFVCDFLRVPVGLRTALKSATTSST